MIHEVLTRHTWEILMPKMVGNTDTVFLAYDVKAIPTLILIDKGKAIFRTQHMNSAATSARVKRLAGTMSH